MSEIIYEPAVTSHWKNLFDKKRMLIGTQNLNPGEELVLTIKAIEADQKVKGDKGREDTVSFMRFEETDLPMCLNIGNSKTIASLYGDYTDKWIGKKIQIHAAEVKAVGGGTTQGLCVRKFIPESNEDISEWEAKVKACESVEEIMAVWETVPKHLHGRVKKFTKARKEELSK